jgi:hypothetical protein
MSKSSDPTKNGDERDRTVARLEKALSALAEVRNELRRVTEERNELRKLLTRVDGVQTATIALPDDDPGPAPAMADVPSLDDLMKALGQIEQAPGDSPDDAPAPRIAGHLHQQVQRPHDTGGEEMIAPQLVFPEQYPETAKADKQQDAGAAVLRVLVLLDAEKPIKYPLYKETMTIGRADIADIQIDNGFLSRLHARVVSTPEGVKIEDAESKNGIRVNSKQTPGQLLKHGDIIDLGRLRLRFIDTTADDAG